MKKYIIGFIVGILISSGIVFALDQINANQVVYINKNNQEVILKDTLDDLYNKVENTHLPYIYLSLDSRVTNGYAVQTNDDVKDIVRNAEYFSINGTDLIINKDCKIRINVVFDKPQTTTDNSPAYKIIYNNADLLTATISRTAAYPNSIIKDSSIVEAKAGDIIQKSISGPKNTAAILLTYIELIED